MKSESKSQKEIIESYRSTTKEAEGMFLPNTEDLTDDNLLNAYQRWNAMLCRCMKNSHDTNIILNNLSGFFDVSIDMYTPDEYAVGLQSEAALNSLYSSLSVVVNYVYDVVIYELLWVRNKNKKAYIELVNMIRNATYLGGVTFSFEEYNRRRREYIIPNIYDKPYVYRDNSEGVDDLKKLLQKWAVMTFPYQEENYTDKNDQEK